MLTSMKTILGPAYDLLQLIALLSNEGSGESAHMCTLVCALAACILEEWVYNCLARMLKTLRTSRETTGVSSDSLNCFPFHNGNFS